MQAHLTVVRVNDPKRFSFGEERGRQPVELTNLVISNLAKEPPTGFDVYVQDTECRGLKLRRDRKPRRDKITGKERVALSFVFVGRVRGSNRLVNKTLGPANGGNALQLAKARSEAMRLHEACREGRNPVSEHRVKQQAARAAEQAASTATRQKAEHALWTLEYASEQMLTYKRERPDERERIRPKTEAFYREAVRNVGKLGRKPTATISTEDVRAVLDDLETPALRAKARRALSAIIEFADRKLCIERRNPVAMLHRKEYRAPRSRTSHIPESRLGEWVTAVANTTNKKDQSLGETAGNLAIALLLYGARFNELALMRWSWIDDDTQTFTIPAEVVKTGRSRTLPLTPAMLAILEQQRPLDGDHVFPGRKRGQAIKSIRAAIEAVGGWTRITDHGRKAFSPHDLRRTFATHFAVVVTEGARLKMILGHAAEDITAQYTQAQVEQMRRDLAAFHAWLASLTPASE